MTTVNYTPDPHKKAQLSKEQLSRLDELSDEDIDELYKKDSNIVDKIFVEINDLNGVGGIADSGDEFQE